MKNKYYCSFNKRCIERSFCMFIFSAIGCFLGGRGDLFFFFWWGVFWFFFRLLCMYSNGFSYYLILTFQCMKITIWFSSAVLISFSSRSVTGGSCDLPFTTKMRSKCLCHTRLTSAVINISCYSLIHTQIERIIFPKFDLFSPWCVSNLNN